MDSFTLNKIAGAALSALLFIFGLKTFIEIKTSGHGGDHAAIGYKLPVTEASVAGVAGGAAAPAAFDPAKVLALLSKATAENGQTVYKKCMACHTPNKGGKNAVGPNMWGIVNRAGGSVADFAYSNALKDKGLTWTYENLARYLHNPKGFIPNNKMAFNGIAEPEELADVLAYLRTLADSPAPLPK